MSHDQGNGTRYCYCCYWGRSDNNRGWKAGIHIGVVKAISVSMTDRARLNSVPKLMLPVYEKIVGLTNKACDKHLNSEYRDLTRAMTAALCRKRPSPLASGHPRTWACGTVYALGRVNFLGNKSFSPYMTTADLCTAFEVGESTVHAKARVI